MASAARMVAVGLLLLSGAGLLSAPPTPAEIAKAIKQLSDDSFEVREQASKVLRAAGKAAEPALEEAAKNKDAEVSRRAQEILEEFKWGIYPDTPAPVANLVNRYRTGDEKTKLEAIRDLIKTGTPGADALRKITVVEDNVLFRQEVQAEIARYLSEAVGPLILAGDSAAIERLVELGLASERDVGYRNYAAWMLFRGKLDEKIPQIKPQVEKDAKAGRDADILFYLCRARGDHAGARWAAEKRTTSSRLLYAILAESGDWKELAQRWSKQEQENFGVEGHTFAVAYQRLAGNRDELEKAVAALRKFGEEHLEDRGYISLAAKGLFLNDRPDEAMALLLKGKQYAPAFDILVFQSKYKEALELAEKDDTDKALQLSKAKVLHTLGLRDKSAPLFTKLTEEIEERTESPTPRDIVKAQHRLGMKAESMAYCAALLKKDTSPETRDPLLGILFPDQGASAGVWWTVFRNQYTADETEKILNKMTQLFEGKLPAKDFDDLLKKAEEVGVGAKEGGEVALQQALAEACIAAGKTDQAITYLERTLAKTTDSAPILRLADLLAEKKSWADAGKRYREAWDKDQSQPLPLYLHGWCLLKAGKEAEGKKAIEAAHEMPLGNEYIRYQFAKALTERGHPADAQRERELILKVGAIDGWACNETFRLSAYAAGQRKDFDQAAESFEQFRLRCMKTGVSFIEFSAHVQVPAMAHQNRARAFLAAGKLDEAKKEWEISLKLVPGNVNLPIALVAALEKAGRKPEADELFKTVFDLHQKLRKDFPQSASNHNTVAWLAAICRRNLDVAEEAATAATKLEPNSAGYLDTFAEVQFQRGNTAKAIDAMKRCIAAEPKNEYFRKQLKRFEAGDPKSEVPEEGE
jgi:tetratricopeptide (TPR) repeat protein